MADIFGRLGYMERQGSGFRKITEAYYAAHNYRAELEPKFYSDITSFQVTLYNLNYVTTFENEKVAFEDEKVAFKHTLSGIKISAPTKEKAIALFEQFEYKQAFGRADIIEMFGIAPSSAGKFLNKLKTVGLINAVVGQGNGKYKFRKLRNKR